MERDRYEYSSLFSVCEEFKEREESFKKGQKSNKLFVFQYESTSKTLRITANETPSHKAKKYKDTHI